ncbi:hypothetical protein K435DRAFT_863519 [Dendrothele bispora CBS 962.96]|uniref:Uncharacterized protein n=1 Tax=Dendrothele bispora (strain CBS 962.96) TaxID=1314807 RepID=A0A4S8LPK5_DENBC|nr:hypothetical protein K435DRAFT_863519 [Dendrothele bispora CBS 962.96]
MIDITWAESSAIGMHPGTRRSALGPVRLINSSSSSCSSLLSVEEYALYHLLSSFLSFRLPSNRSRNTAGLTLASRLFEKLDVSILVLEAGNPNIDDPLITRPGQFSAHFMKPEKSKQTPIHTPPDSLLKKSQNLKSQTHSHVLKSFRNTPGTPPISGQEVKVSVEAPPSTFFPSGLSLRNKTSTISISIFKTMRATRKPGMELGDVWEVCDPELTYTPAPLSEPALNVWDVKNKSLGTRPLKIIDPRVIPEVELKVQETLVKMGVPPSSPPTPSDPTSSSFLQGHMHPDRTITSSSGQVLGQPHTLFWRRLNSEQEKKKPRNLGTRLGVKFSPHTLPRPLACLFFPHFFQILAANTRYSQTDLLLFISARNPAMYLKFRSAPRTFNSLVQKIRHCVCKFSDTGEVIIFITQQAFKHFVAEFDVSSFGDDVNANGKLHWGGQRGAKFS